MKNLFKFGFFALVLSLSLTSCHWFSSSNANPVVDSNKVDSSQIDSLKIEKKAIDSGKLEIDSTHHRK